MRELRVLEIVLFTHCFCFLIFSVFLFYSFSLFFWFTHFLSFCLLIFSLFFLYYPWLTLSGMLLTRSLLTTVRYMLDVFKQELSKINIGDKGLWFSMHAFTSQHQNSFQFFYRILVWTANANSTLAWNAKESNVSAFHTTWKIASAATASAWWKTLEYHDRLHYRVLLSCALQPSNKSM